MKLSYRTATSIDRLDITFNGMTFGIGNSGIGVKNLNGYIDELIISGKSYKNVTKGSTSYYNIFLNNNYGLLKVEYFNDNINWVYYQK